MGKWKEVGMSDAVDIKKSPNLAYEGIYTGSQKITTKIGEQTIYNFMGPDNKSYGIYGFTTLNGRMARVAPGTNCRITYIGTKELKTKFGMKPVHIARVETEEPEVAEEGAPEAA